MQILATNLPLDDFRPQRIYYVGFDFDDYPEISIHRMQMELREAERKALKEKRKNQRMKIGGHHEDAEYIFTCGFGRVEAMSQDGPQQVSRGEKVKERVPSYGRDDLFASINEPIKPITTRSRIDPHWGKSVWPTGGF